MRLGKLGRVALIPLLTTALAAPLALATSTAASASDGRALYVRETAAGHVSLSSSNFHAGLVNINISSAVTGPQGHDIEVFRLQPGTTLAQLQAKLALAFNPKTPGPVAGQTVQVWINQHVRLYGGYQDPSPGQLSYRVVLPAGQYYAADLFATTPAGVATFRVFGRSYDSLPYANQSVRMVTVAGMDQFAVSNHGNLRNGLLRITNTTDELHFAQAQPVKPGTTNAQVTAAFSGKGPNPALPGPTPGTGVLSPGVSINVLLRLPPGTYAVLCFMPDKETGMPHALPPMNMHVVVHLHN